MFMSKIIVAKFGGTSVADSECRSIAANKIVQEIEKGYHVAVVISAMAGVTDDLVAQVSEINPNIETQQAHAERDQVVITGELVNAALFALALQNAGLEARSFNAAEAQIKAQGEFGRALIGDIDASKALGPYMKRSQSHVPVICAGQAVSADGRLMATHRGSGDLTAVEVAVALNAERCDIYTDVDGVYDFDPHRMQGARRFSNVSYGDMADMAREGAQVLDLISVRRASEEHMCIQVLSSAPDALIGSDSPGTIISSDPSEFYVQDYVPLTPP